MLLAPRDADVRGVFVVSYAMKMGSTHGAGTCYASCVVAGMTTQNAFENPVVQQQVIFQDIPQAPQVVDSSPLLGDVAAREYNQALQPPVIFQEITEVQVVASQTALNTSSTSTSSGVPAATHAATALAASDVFPILPILDDSRRRRRILNGTRSRLLLFSSVRLKQPPATSASGRNWLMSITYFSCTHRQLVQTTKGQLASRHANVLLMFA